LFVFQGPRCESGFLSLKSHAVTARMSEVRIWPVFGSVARLHSVICDSDHCGLLLERTRRKSFGLSPRATPDPGSSFPSKTCRVYSCALHRTLSIASIDVDQRAVAVLPGQPMRILHDRPTLTHSPLSSSASNVLQSRTPSLPSRSTCPPSSGTLRCSHSAGLFSKT
jgi:hypothetical protein